MRVSAPFSFGQESPDRASPGVSPSIRLLLHPVTLLALWVGVGSLFGVQNYVELRGTAYRMTMRDSIVVWSLYALCNGSGFLAMWFPLKHRIQNSSWRFLVFRLLPLSILSGALSEMAYARLFPFFVQPTQHLTYWTRVRADLSAEWLSNVAFFWVAIFLVLGIGYYDAAKSREVTNVELQRELTSAQLRALRMQLNPHFLFNTLNGISGLMREDVDRADSILEQLGQLLRMTLDRGDSELVSLREEMDFIRLYLEIQCARFGERLTYRLDIPTHLYDVVVPTMIVQPIVENAYAHGIAPSLRGGYINVCAQDAKGIVKISVTNSGIGLRATKGLRGLGLENVRARLQLHYGQKQEFNLSETNTGTTVATLSLPLERGQR